ncbi:leucyl aminopeptidase [Candidatus Pseudothioglobus sp. Uisw_050_01]|uniref:leucyl aminopeptidase n=1 Tax=Candidatus Pseudothioglobus sp. Uisw_050_01 TaxID=3230997 RepID=UPI003A8BA973
MEFFVTHQAADHYSGDCSVAFVFKDTTNENRILQGLLELHRFEANLGETLMLGKVEGYKSKRVLAIGLGESPLTQKKYIKVLKSLSSAMDDTKVKNVVIPSLEVEGRDDSWLQITTARVLKNESYQIKKVGLEVEKKATVLEAVNIYSENNGITEISKGVAIANGMALARELGDLPPNICTPTYIAEIAQLLASTYKLKCEVLEESDMEALGMNSLLSVSLGSSQPAKLISLNYSNGGKEDPIVLVGKGVTFDSGGISLKPGSGMDEMKYDMCGAASVLGTMSAVAEMGIKVNLTVVVPTVENMPAHNASRPGDVVKSMSGQTIEILNTDAEGRLILCDALTYCEKFNPKVVIDVATLTGAVIVALGKHHSGVMSNDQNLADSLKASGISSMDTVWQLPLDDEYDELLKSNFADMANIGGREAGTVTAACFLARYTKNYSWAHIDIAGTAWLGGSKKGATGRPVPLLTQYVMDQV